MEVATGNQLIDQKPSHDRLARAGIVGQEKAERLPGSMASYTAVIWCGNGSTTDVCTARTGSNSMSEPNTLGLG